jgi:hypothetical protein
MVISVEKLMDYAEIAQRDAKEWLAFADERPQDKDRYLKLAANRLSDAAFYIRQIEYKRAKSIT